MKIIEIARRPAEWLYEATADVFVRRPFKDPRTKATKPGPPELVEEAVPCRISHDGQPPSDSSTGLPTAGHAAKLFCAPGVSIPPGSKVIVTQDGVTEYFASAGIAAKYCSHQEINLDEWGGWI